jgi:hypothetical protein
MHFNDLFEWAPLIKKTGRSIDTSERHEHRVGQSSESSKLCGGIEVALGTEFATHVTAVYFQCLVHNVFNLDDGHRRISRMKQGVVKAM